MVYRDFQELSLSALGMGTMRLPVMDGDDGRIDEAAAAEMVSYAMSRGINYYAYGGVERKAAVRLYRVQKL